MLGPPREVLSDPQVIEAYLGHKYATRAAQLSEAASAALAAPTPTPTPNAVDIAEEEVGPDA